MAAQGSAPEVDRWGVPVCVIKRPMFHKSSGVVENDATKMDEFSGQAST